MKAKPQPLTAPAAKSVGIWIRVSTEDQAQGESPEHHEARARNYAAAKGWNVREVYDLAGVSGKSVMEHPEAKRMLRDLQRGHIKALIFSKLARLARNTKELLEFADTFRAANADLISLQESIDTSTPSGRLFYTMIAAMAQWEREEIGDRIKASIQIRAKLGKPTNGKSPYGYHWKDKKLVPHPVEGPVRKLAYELFLKHRRKGRVAREMNASGYRTRAGCPWSDMAIGRILTDWSAKGTHRLNVYRRTGAWTNEIKDESEWGSVECEPLVSETVWNQANQIIEEQQGRKVKRPGRKPVQTFAGLAHCHCGARMYVRTGTRKYICEACRNKIAIEDLDAIFIEELKSIFGERPRVTAHLASAALQIEEKQKLLANQQGELQKVRDEMAKTHRLYLDGHIPIEEFGNYHKPLAERLLQLQTDIPRLEGEIDFARVQNLSADAVTNEAQSLYANWPQLPPDNRRRVVEALVEKIVIGKDDLEITFSASSPLEDMTKNQQVADH